MRVDFTRRPWRWMFHGGNDPETRPVRIAQGVILIVLLAAVIFLVRADKPWHPRILERWGEDRPLNLGQMITVGLYCAAALNALLLVALHGTARWWARAMPVGDPRKGAWIPPKRWMRAGWLAALLLAVGCAGAMRWNLAHGSLWWDETWNLTRVVHGERLRDAEDPSKLVFRPAGWDRAFFYYAKPTNHVLFSIASKVSLTVWQKVTGRERWEFDEFFFRLPNFLAALAAVFAIAWLLRDWGYPVAGLVAAWLLALHPWHIRYGIDARAFSSVALIAILSCFVLSRALRSGLWRYWLGFGALQWLLLWSFPYAIYLTITLATGAVLAIFAQTSLPRWQMVGRFAVGGIAGAMLLLQVMAPNALFIPGWSGIEGHGRIGTEFVAEVWASIVSGMPWLDRQWSSGLDGIPSLGVLAGEQPWLLFLKLLFVPGLAVAGAAWLLFRQRKEAVVLAFWLIAVPLTLGPNLEALTEQFVWLRVIVFFVLPCLAVAGAAWLLVRQGREGIILAGWLLALPVAVAFAWGKTHYFYPRYVIYGLPAFLVAVAVAIEGYPRLIGNLKVRVSITWALAIALPLGFLGSTELKRDILLTRPYSPNREVAEFLAEVAEPEPNSILACGFGLGGREPQIYNPWLLYANNREELLAMMQRSREENKPLYLFLGYEGFNRGNQPSAFPLIDDRALFHPVIEFHGIESQFLYRVFRYTGEVPAP